MRRLKRFLATTGGLLVIFLAILAALPLWFPWVLSPVLSHYRVHYSDYRRLGFTRFSVNNIEYRYKGVLVQAGHAEALLPTAWLWEKIFIPPTRQEFFVNALNWQVNIFPPKSNGPGSVYHTLKVTWPWVDRVRQWVPKGMAHQGVIRFPGEEMAVSEARWTNSQLTATVSDPRLHQTAAAEINLGAEWAARLNLQPWDVDAQLRVQKPALTLDADLALTWRSNHAAVAVEFARMGLLPARLSVDAPSIALPAAQIGLKKYRRLTGSVSGLWQDDKFRLDLLANAQPENTTNKMTPPLTAVFRATGDRERFQIAQAKISSPGVSAELTKPLEMTYNGKMLSDEAVLRLNADVSRQSLLPVTGQLDGQVLLRREEWNMPDVFFDLTGRNLAGFGIAPAEVNLEGSLIWPSLKLNLLNLQFTNRSVVDAHGEIDLPSRTVRQGSVTVDGLVGRKFLPTNVNYKTLALSAELSGPLAALRHSGRLKIGGLALPGLRPLDVTGDWQGQATSITNFQAVISPGKAVLTLQGAASPGQLALNSAALTGVLRPLALESPAQFTWRRGRFGAPSLRWRGGASDLSLAGFVQWPPAGNFSVSAHEFSLDLLGEFLSEPLPAIDIVRLQSDFQWSNGPVHFSADASAHFDPALNLSWGPTNLPFTAEIKATGDERGVQISRFELTTAGAAIVSANGSVPVTFDPQGYHMQLDQPLQLQARTRPNPRFWSDLTARQRFTLDAPSLDLSVTGTWRDPSGTLKLAARSVEVQFATNFPRLNFTDLSGDLAISPRAIDVKHFEAQVEQQPFSVQGKMPLPRQWKDLLDWKKASVQLQATNVQLAALTRFAPKILTAEGTLNLNMAATNGHLSGELTITNAVSQPLLQNGAIQNLSADIKMSDQKIHIARFAGLVGGGPVVLSGDVDLGRKDPVTALPYFKLAAQGNGVPLARTAAMILRTGFDVSLSNEKGGQPIFEGMATLTNSYYLNDPKLLVPGSLATPENRPPYFSVTTGPFADWRLDLSVSGNKFLQVHSPFFNGVVSASFHLSGSLREPLALGNVQINSGQIAFPFANLNVTQGNVFLTTARPYLPQLLINASARAFAYDLRMTASGPADQPLFEFTSTPGLTSDQILLMLTTGELPVTVTSFSTEQRASRVGVFLGENTLSQLGLFPGGEERLSVGSGEAFGELTFPDEVTETYSAEYKLSTNWWLIGQYDPFGVNLGLKWRFYSK